MESRRSLNNYLFSEELIGPWTDQIPCYDWLYYRHPQTRQQQNQKRKKWLLSAVYRNSSSNKVSDSRTYTPQFRQRSNKNKNKSEVDISKWKKQSTLNRVKTQPCEPEPKLSSSSISNILKKYLPRSKSIITKNCPLEMKVPIIVVPQKKVIKKSFHERFKTEEQNYTFAFFKNTKLKKRPAKKQMFKKRGID